MATSSSINGLTCLQTLLMTIIKEPAFIILLELFVNPNAEIKS